MRISDWSSDVCSSDLRLHRRAVTASQDDAAEEVPLVREIHRRVAQGMAAALGVGGIHRRAASLEVGELAGSIVGAHQDPAAIAQIGRASCRERVGQYVEISVVAVALTKKKRETHENK